MSRIAQARENPPSTFPFDFLHEIFEATVDTHPDSIAVLFDGEETSYAELEERSNRLAHYLHEKGLQPGSLVGILLQRSLDAYVGLLAVLKTGAAYVPIDPEYPANRVDYILADSGIGMLVTTSNLSRHYATFGGVVVRIDIDRKAIKAQSSTRPSWKNSGAYNRDICYVIYTSGSTGRPKGVQIEHRSACNLVLAEGKIFQVRPEDHVCQAASLSFDLSVEEVWLAFYAGATIVGTTPGMANIGPDFVRFLKEYKVTVLSCVPTLLSTLEEELPDLRLIILGGEACPESLVKRWSRLGRRIVNTYGPTEATVIATYTELVPEKQVTIGKAVPGYRVYILDEHLQPVSQGSVGQICIGGMGVARGYIGLEAETRVKFLPDPFALTDETDARMYLTGDLGRFDNDNNIEFLGRQDAQVKLRGFRVELTEIESVLMEDKNAFAAACTVREDVPGIKQLVAYVVPRECDKLDIEKMRLHLRERLPPFMIPSLIEVINDLPRLPSGKLDRASLPAPKALYTIPQSIKLPRTISEKKIFKIWEDVFRPQTVSVDDNFFLDLGGHSLLAARMVSELRKDEQFSSISVLDLYENPTIESLAKVLDAKLTRTQQTSVHSQRISREKEMIKLLKEHVAKNQHTRHFLTNIIQAASFYVIFGFMAIEWITPYLVFFLLLANHYSVLTAITWSAASAIAVFPFLFTVALTAKWIVLGRIRPGRYPLGGSYYLRWWFVQTLLKSLPIKYMAGTPLLPFFYRLLGVKIGKSVHIETDMIAAFDLISIGDESTICNDVSIGGYTIEDGMLVIDPVKIGHNCFVGTRSVIREATVMEDGSRLGDLSLLQRGLKIPRGQTWAGSPAKYVSGSRHAVPPPPVQSKLRRAGLVVLYGMLLLLSPLILLAAIMPGVILLTGINPVAQPLMYLPAIPLVGASFVFFIGIEVVMLKWLIAGRIKAGTYPVHSRFYIRNWFVQHLLSLSLDLIAPLHSTLYLVPWYRALGAKIGNFVEISNVTSSTPDLIEIKDGSMIADEASLGVAEVEGGWMTVRKTDVGRRTFVGNSAVIPEGTILGDESLLGVLSLSPKEPSDASKPKTSWLGSPPILLPRRQSSFLFPKETTFNPTRKIRLTRGAIEILRVTLPASGFLVVATAVIMAMENLSAFAGLGTAFLLLPVVYGLCCASVALMVVVAKWTMIGRFRPFERPLWSTFVWRLEFVNALYEFLATPLFLEVLKGTPLLSWYLRLLGAKIGDDVYIQTTGFLEFDLVDIGDRVILNEDCVLQTHLFEDRVMKASKFRIGSDCNVGPMSVILYDSEMEDGTKIDALSLLMKGEKLPARTRWVGIPAKRSE